MGSPTHDWKSWADTRSLPRQAEKAVAAGSESARGAYDWKSWSATLNLPRQVEKAVAAGSESARGAYDWKSWSATANLPRQVEKTVAADRDSARQSLRPLQRASGNSRRLPVGGSTVRAYFLLNCS